MESVFKLRRQKIVETIVEALLLGLCLLASLYGVVQLGDIMPLSA